MKALVIVDVQYDFVPGGALPVPRGDEVVGVINQLQDHFDVVVATQDWHPPDHVSFAVNHGKQPGEVIEVDGVKQVLWPVHCVQGTRGAELLDELRKDRIERVFQKGTNPRIDSYSGFFDNNRQQSTGLADYLKERGVTEVYVCGLATDYCVKYTALDAKDLGFETYVIRDATRGVDLNPGDVERALEEMRAKGIHIVESREILEGAAERAESTDRAR